MQDKTMPKQQASQHKTSQCKPTQHNQKTRQSKTHQAKHDNKARPGNTISITRQHNNKTIQQQHKTRQQQTMITQDKA